MFAKTDKMDTIFEFKIKVKSKDIDDLNHVNNVVYVQWMDEVAYIAATRFSRKTMVTISTEQVDFKHPIPSGILVELIARVVHVGRTSLKVEVSIFLEQLDSDKRTKAVTGHFNFVAVDSNKKPTPIFDKETSA